MAQLKEQAFTGTAADVAARLRALATQLRVSGDGDHHHGIRPGGAAKILCAAGARI